MVSSKQSNKSILLQSGKGPWRNTDTSEGLWLGAKMTTDHRDQHTATLQMPEHCACCVLCVTGAVAAWCSRQGACKYSMCHVVLLSLISELCLGHFPPVVSSTWLLNPFSLWYVWAQHFHDPPEPGVSRHTEGTRILNVHAQTGKVLQGSLSLAL